VLRQRSEHGEAGLSNAEIRQITCLDRYQVVRLMKELQHEDVAVVREGVGKGSHYRDLRGRSDHRVLCSSVICTYRAQLCHVKIWEGASVAGGFRCRNFHYVSSKISGLRASRSSMVIS